GDPERRQRIEDEKRRRYGAVDLAVLSRFCCGINTDRDRDDERQKDRNERKEGRDRDALQNFIHDRPLVLERDSEIALELVGHPEVVLVIRSVPFERQPLRKRQEFVVGVFLIAKDRPVPDRLVEMPLGADLLNDLLIELLIAALRAFGANAGLEFCGVARGHPRDPKTDNRYNEQRRNIEEDPAYDVLKQCLVSAKS